MASGNQTDEKSFLQEVMETEGGRLVLQCYQCGTCSGSCPVIDEMEYGPRRILYLIQQNQEAAVLSSKDMWRCVSCYSCANRCPRGIEITDLMADLRRMSLAKGYAHDKEAEFAQAFAETVQMHGRMFEPEVIGRMAREGINDIPLQMLLEMWAQMNEPVQSEGPYAHESRLGDIQVPVQAISGNVDNVAPFAAVEAAVARLNGPDVRYRKMGRTEGDRADYGHGDLLVGRAAPEEVFPMLIDFIEEMD